MRLAAAQQYTENLAYFLGDTWPFWIGPTLPVSDPDYGKKMSRLQRVFQNCNTLRECCLNWKDGLISQPFNWYLKTVDGDRADSESEQVKKAERDLQRWLDWVAEQAGMTDPAASNFQQSDPWSEFVLSLGVLGEGALRLWQPDRYANDPDPVHRIHLHAVRAGSLEIDRSLTDGFIDLIRYSHSTGIETHRIDGQDAIVNLAGGLNLNQAEELRLGTGGRWLIQLAQGQPLLTDSVKRLQNSINHSLTMKYRNNEIAGFREYIISNAELPDAAERGPGRDMYLYGIPTGDPSSPSYTIPQIFQAQPVSTASLGDSIKIDRTLIYLEFGQGHLLSAGDGSLSGESRVQMRQGFELQLRGWQRRIEGSISAVLNIVLRLLGYEQFEAVVELQITTGKLSTEERAEIRNDFQAGLLSRSSAIAHLGLAKDVDAEIALIDEEAQQQTTRPSISNSALPNPVAIAQGTIEADTAGA